MKHEPKKVYQAIKDVVAEVVQKFGIDFVKTLSMFPSSNKVPDNEA